MRTPPRGRTTTQLLADFGHDLRTKRNRNGPVRSRTCSTRRRAAASGVRDVGGVRRGRRSPSTG